jgi:hypothetical protein
MTDNSLERRRASVDQYWSMCQEALAHRGSAKAIQLRAFFVNRTPLPEITDKVDQAMLRLLAMTAFEECILRIGDLLSEEAK